MPVHPIRFISAAALFDGHDASINIIRRILMSSGAEVIHLGHNRAVEEVAIAAIQEDVQGVAISSYQGGHVEYFEFLRQSLDERGGAHIEVFGGGGGVIIPEEIARLSQKAVRRIYTPEDGRLMGLQGIIQDMLEHTDFDPSAQIPDFPPLSFRATAATISALEKGIPLELPPRSSPVLGITGPGGAGKSSLCDELILRLLEHNAELKIAILAVDPTRPRSGGALLGDRIRFNSLALFPERLYFRSLATRGADVSTSPVLKAACNALSLAGYDLIIIETGGSGQADAAIVPLCDYTLYVMTPEFGAPSQLEKIAMLDYANLVAINKVDKSGSLDAIDYVRKQLQRNREAFQEPPDSMPVFPTTASRFHDAGVDALSRALCQILPLHLREVPPSVKRMDAELLPGGRRRYLSEIADRLRTYRSESLTMARRAALVEALQLSSEGASSGVKEELEERRRKEEDSLDPDLRNWLADWPRKKAELSAEKTRYRVREEWIEQKLKFTSLAGLHLPVVALPDLYSAYDLSLFYYKENLPGSFPFTAGVFPYRKADEMPTRMFAGEGGPERTNGRFHYLSQNQTATRLSTAFDSVTLYGEDPGHRPDVYGKIGNAGVSVATLDDCKRLYSGFDLIHPSTSVSMTINGPAPIILAFFLNTAIDQAVEDHLTRSGRKWEAQKKIEEWYRERGLPQPQYRKALPSGHNGQGLLSLGISAEEIIERETYENIKATVLNRVRGTVQADILKEDQAQNTCIFSTEFALRMMGDVQAYFIEQKVRNFYSVSISGYHIAEAGANPITQLAFTLANGFTYAEYYRSRGMHIDDFAPNFSFFFSNGLDAEYAVIGRVARRIWAVAMRHLYGANERSQKLKYHIQTSGRSLHAREIDFNDIRTTLQALYAIYDNCNSLHTNSYDEAVTTPTEESVRRALAIQLIINQELGLNQCHNPVQGAYIISELTDLVEEAVLMEFDRLTERGGVLGAMETMYQRSKIQSESLFYEEQKHSGALPIIGINTFLGSSAGMDTVKEVIRSTDAEKEEQITATRQFQEAHRLKAETALLRLKQAAWRGDNIFKELMETVKVASLGQISRALYETGGRYRRSM